MQVAIWGAKQYGIWLREFIQWQKKTRSLFIWNRHITMTMWRQRQRCRSSLTMQRGSLSLWRNFPPGVRARGCIMNVKPASHHHGLDHGVNTSAPFLATSFVIDEANLWVLNLWSLPRSKGQCMHGHSGGNGHQWDSHLPLQTHSCSETDRTSPAIISITLNERKGLWGELIQDFMQWRELTCRTVDKVPHVNSSHIWDFAVNGNLPTSSLRRSKMVRMS